MTVLPLDQLKKAVSQNWQDPYYRDIDNVIELLEENELLIPLREKNHIFFAKNIFKPDMNVEFYFITKEIITVFSYLKDGQDQYSLSARTIPIKNSIVELTDYNPYGQNAICNIYLQNEETISFSATDANQNWQRGYQKAVVSIYKYLTT